jgi:hypothetical protein
MDSTFKLYKVTLQNSVMKPCGVSYVVALSTDEAYKQVRDYLEKKDWGFNQDRELEMVELIAEDYEYTNLSHKLFISPILEVKKDI